MDENERHWLAGLLEGEGCFFMGNGGRSPRIHTRSTDLDVLERAMDVAGVGTLRGPTWHGRSSKPFWTWAVENGSEAAALMANMHPLLGKRRRAKIEDLLAAFREGERHPAYARRKPLTPEQKARHREAQARWRARRREAK